MMLRYSWCAATALAACRLASAQTTTTAAASFTPTSSVQTSAPTSNLPAFEIDVLFPRENETYNYTSSLPIVFTFQNLTAAAELGPFRFLWVIMPYNSIKKPIPGGTINDQWVEGFTSENVSTFTNPNGSPFVLTNYTNPKEWNSKPNYGGTAYALQWYIQWDYIEAQCDYPNLAVLPSNGSQLLFTLLPAWRGEWSAPNPSALGNVTDNCAQLGTLAMVDANKSNACSMDQLRLGESGNPCAIKPDEAMVSSMSSVVESLSASQSLATATPTTTESPVTPNAAVATGVSVQPALAAALVLGGWELWSLS
ncbi:uncharacterized protein ALTATR162_LOCUS5852 [Alternaria atra]|uniref:DUF7136 domain-containing protein n=1 Tax=Alternaria atra TaxID=119953 RepID=A0A8J2N221_9PLEO|nr:uncharacterized protein ALTATR162_LOCUS5852 [Alternaria atra]CAG5160562.1 unnamed protein product [Alternaria atra]